jgi:hypothetical protein
LRQELSDVHSDRDAWRSEVKRLILIAYRRNEHERLPWWKRLAGWAATPRDPPALCFENVVRRSDILAAGQNRSISRPVIGYLSPGSQESDVVGDYSDSTAPMKICTERPSS